MSQQELSQSQFKSFHETLLKMHENKYLEKHRDKLAKTITEIERYWCVSDKNNSSLYFDYFCEWNIPKEFIFLWKLQIKEINLSILNFLSVLILNLTNLQTLYYFYSTPWIDEIIRSNFNDDEYISYQINFMKSLCLKLNEETVKFFFDKTTNSFPLVQKALSLYNSKDGMIRNVVRNIIWTIWKINDNALREFMVSFPVNWYYINIVIWIREKTLEINSIDIDQDINNMVKIKNAHDQLIDWAYFLEDLLSLKLEKINYIIINSIISEIFFPCLRVVFSMKQEKVELILSLYIIILLLHVIQDNQLYDLFIKLLFYDKISDNELKKIEASDLMNSTCDLVKGFIDDIFFKGSIISQSEQDSAMKLFNEHLIKIVGVNLQNWEYDNNSVYNICLESFNNNQMNTWNNPVLESILVFFKTKDDTFVLLLNIWFANVFEKIIKNKNETDIKSKIDSLSKASSIFLDNDNKENVLLTNFFSMLSLDRWFRWVTTRIIYQNITHCMTLFPASFNSLKEQWEEFFFTIIMDTRTLLNTNSQIKTLSFEYFHDTYKKYTSNLPRIINDIINLPYILIPYIFHEKIPDLPKIFHSSGQEDEKFKIYLISFQYLHDIMSMLKNRPDQLIRNNPFPLNTDNITYNIGKVINISEFQGDYTNCVLVEKDKNGKDYMYIKCEVMITLSMFYIAEIISDNYQDLSALKIRKSIPIRHLDMKINEYFPTVIVFDNKWERNDEEEHLKKQKFDPNKYLIHLDFFNGKNANSMFNIIKNQVESGVNIEYILLESYLDSMTELMFK